MDLDKGDLVPGVMPNWFGQGRIVQDNFVQGGKVDYYNICLREICPRCLPPRLFWPSWFSIVLSMGLFFKVFLSKA